MNNVLKTLSFSVSTLKFSFQQIVYNQNLNINQIIRFYSDFFFYCFNFITEDLDNF